MLLDMINLVKVRKAILCSLALLCVIFLQDVVLARVRILGVMPFITPLGAVAVGFFNGGVWGAVFGLIGGILTDDALNGSPVMMTVLFPILGFFAGTLPVFLVSRRLASFALMGAAALLITALCQMFKYLVFTDTAVLPLFTTVGLQVLWSLPFIFAVYFPFKAICGLDLSK